MPVDLQTAPNAYLEFKAKSLRKLIENDEWVISRWGVGELPHRITNRLERNRAELEKIEFEQNVRLVRGAATPSFNQTGTVTGRTSSLQPNLQNIRRPPR